MTHFAMEPRRWGQALPLPFPRPGGGNSVLTGTEREDGTASDIPCKFRQIYILITLKCFENAARALSSRMIVQPVGCRKRDGGASALIREKFSTSK
jgi:hypothetical protein